MKINCTKSLLSINFFRTALMVKAIVISILSTSTAQDSIKLKPPVPGESTFYSNIEWNKNDIFSTIDYVKWDYTNLRPTTIVKEKFEEYNGDHQFSTTPTVQWTKAVGDIQYFAIENNEVVLVGETKKSDFTNSQVVHYDIQGVAVEYPIMIYSDMVITNQYDKVAKLSMEEVRSFSNLPTNCDSLKVIISIEEYATFSRVMDFALYHSESPAIMKNTHDQSTLEFQIKFKDDSNWYPYVYNRVDVPPSLMPVASQAYTRTYKYYNSEYTFPVFSFRRTNRNILEIQLQDNVNIFNVPLIEVGGKTITTLTKPGSDIYNFKLINYPIGAYRLQIYNITGKRIKLYSFSMDVNNEFEANLASLPKGIYFYNFIDFLGQRTSTHRFTRV